MIRGIVPGEGMPLERHDRADDAAPSATAPASRRTLAVLTLAVFAHALARAAFVLRGHPFACEDDPYRLYVAYQLGRDFSRAIGRFWLPGQLLGLAALMRAGVPAAWAGPVLGALAVTALAAALGDAAHSLAPPGDSDTRASAAALVFASPLTLVLGHSALAETQAGALLAGCAAMYLRARPPSDPEGWRLRPLALASVLLLCASWVRYESWAFVPVFAALSARPGPNRPARAALGLVPLLGPLTWMALQRVVHGDALGFVAQSQSISEALVGPASRVRVLGHRVEALAVWSLPVVAWAAAAFALRGRRNPPGRAYAALAALGALPALAEVLSGTEHAVFPDRFAYEIELGLVPLAALGLSEALAHARGRLALAGAVATVLALAPAALEPPAMRDEASVRLGLALRAGALDATLQGGSLLVERPRRRPPFGWASVGVLWERWDRVVYATPGREGWQLVEPTDVRAQRPAVPVADLGAWLDRRGVTAAWLVSDEAMRALRAAWPGGSVRDAGDHALYVRTPR